ncbi:MAG: nonstructural protein [Microvirus sp.]|nr:MAG: nonstructural protein [Microvirus sp.]
MKTKLYSIYDAVINVTHFPFQAHNDNDAKRSLLNAATDPNSHLYNNPSDFSLYYMGTYDDQEAIFEPISTPQLVVRLAQLIAIPTGEEK